MLLICKFIHSFIKYLLVIKPKHISVLLELIVQRKTDIE